MSSFNKKGLYEWIIMDEWSNVAAYDANVLARNKLRMQAMQEVGGIKPPPVALQSNRAFERWWMRTFSSVTTNVKYRKVRTRLDELIAAEEVANRLIL